jgi:transposase
MAFRRTIDDPNRFKRSSDVGAYLGLTPRRYDPHHAQAACRKPLVMSKLFGSALRHVGDHPKARCECQLNLARYEIPTADKWNYHDDIMTGSERDACGPAEYTPFCNGPDEVKSPL